MRCYGKAPLQLSGLLVCLVQALFGSVEPIVAVSATTGPLMSQHCYKDGVSWFQQAHKFIADLTGLGLRLNQPKGVHYPAVWMRLEAFKKVFVSLGMVQLIRNCIDIHREAQSCSEDREATRYRGMHWPAKSGLSELDKCHVKSIKAWFCTLAARKGSLEGEAV